MSSYSTLVERAQQALLTDVFTGAGQATLERAADPARVAEAEAVAPVVERFADYEIEPPGGKGVGRAIKIAIIPPLGSVIGEKKIGRLDDDGLEELRQCIGAPLAWGYVALASVPGVMWGEQSVEPRPDADPSELWAAWVPQLFAGLGPDNDTGLGGRTGSGPLDGVHAQDRSTFDRAMKAARSRATEEFNATLNQLGLMPGRLKRMRLKLIGPKYVDAGMLLRLAQSVDLPGGDSQFGRSFVERNWPFEAAAD
jgi:hypothetical protein